MTAMADGGGQPPKEQLGTVLVNRGLITPEELATALAEQKASGEPLGAIVVQKGFAPPALVAQALATQAGAALKTEYGFATGFGNGLQPPVSFGAPPVSPERVAGASRNAASAVLTIERQVVDDLVEVVQPDPAEDREAVRSELAMASHEAEKLEAANARLAEARAELERRVAQETQRAAALEKQVADLTENAIAWEKAHTALREELERVQAAGAAPAEVDHVAAAELESLREELRTVEAARAELAEQLAAAESRADSSAELEQIESLQATIGELEDRLGAAEARAAATVELEQKLAAQTGATVELEQKLVAQTGATVDLEQKLAAQTAATAELEQRLAEQEAQRAAAEDPWAAAAAHLLFFRGADGYELVERSGPPPEVGAAVGVGNAGRQVVARIAAAPVPGSELPCAYLN